VGLLAAVNDKSNAVISINATGVIQMANKTTQKLLGARGLVALVLVPTTAPTATLSVAAVLPSG
jgi:sensor histidine kinase regulating citrate/malate metabolism